MRVLHLAPSEFWAMSPQEFWLLMDMRDNEQMIGTMRRSTFDTLKGMLH